MVAYIDLIFDEENDEHVNQFPPGSTEGNRESKKPDLTDNEQPVFDTIQGSRNFKEPYLTNENWFIYRWTQKRQWN